jgi:hypothetical protein
VGAGIHDIIDIAFHNGNQLAKAVADRQSAVAAALEQSQTRLSAGPRRRRIRRSGAFDVVS